MSVFRPQYRELSTVERGQVEQIKWFAHLLLKKIEEGKPNREKSLAKTKLEEAVMWAVKGVTG